MRTFLAKPLRLLAVLIALSIPMAKTADAANGPDPSANPVLANIMKLGSRVYSLGNKDGLDGWMIVKDGQGQFMYTKPNSQYALLGALFGPNGENVSADQVNTLLSTNKALNDELNASI